VILRSDVPERPVDSVPGYCCICNARDGAAIWAEAGYLGRVCDCGLVYIDPFPLFGPQDRTDFHAAEYYAIAARLRLRWLRHYAPKGRLLEIGCGRGDFLRAAHEAGYSVAAVEPNAAHLRELHTWEALELYAGFLHEVDLPPQRFDVVFHVDLMSHFVDPLDALRTMRRATRPGGVVAFEVGLLAGMSPRWYKWQRAVGYPQHRWLYSQKAIYCLLDKAGLRPMATQQFGLLPETLPSGLLRQVRHLLPTKKTTHVREVTADVPAPSARGIHYLLEHLIFGLRYGAGRWAPKLGPTTAFIAARRV
jgi:SAM-dependent methyltransferase